MKPLLEKLDEGYHLALVNKKTGKIASSNNWQWSLAALAYQSKNHSGIASVLPQSKAQRLLLKNKLTNKKRRGDLSNIASRMARKQAKSFIPVLISYYERQLPFHRAFRRYEFCKWITKTLGEPTSSASVYASIHGYDELINKVPGARWWQDQYKKLQS